MDRRAIDKRHAEINKMLDEQEKRKAAEKAEKERKINAIANQGVMVIAVILAIYLLAYAVVAIGKSDTYKNAIKTVDKAKAYAGRVVDNLAGDHKDTVFIIKVKGDSL